jgi:tetratricopeptide (TPR) repeat protein
VQLNGLAIIAAYHADLDRSRALFEESLALRRSNGDQRGIAQSLNNLGYILLTQGDDDRAVMNLFEESLDVSRAIGETSLAAYALANLGDLAFKRMDIDRARALYKEALGMFHERGDKREVAHCLERFAEVIAARGSLVPAACLFGAAEALRVSIGTPIPATARADYDTYVELVRQGLDVTTLERSWRAGRDTPLDQTIADVMSESSLLETPD